MVHSLSAVSVVLLIAYPLIDVVASLLDAGDSPGTAARRLRLLGITFSALAAVALGLAAIGGIGVVLFAFGIWAIVSGAAQFSIALRRRGSGLGGQWPMLTAGALSVIAGTTFLAKAMGEQPSLGALTTYAAAGGTFFVLQGVMFVWRRRRAPVRQAGQG